MASVLDPDVVDQLRELARAGNPGLLNKLQASFARDTSARLRALRTAVARADVAAVAFNLHSLKGSAANLGAIEIVATCEQIERSQEGSGARQLEPLILALEGHAADAQPEYALEAEAR